MSKNNDHKPEKRYITMLGDPIHGNPVGSFVTAPDFSIMGLATAFTAAVAAGTTAGSEDELLHSVLNCSMMNAGDMVVSRIIFERTILKNMARLDLENSCIDLAPDFQTAAKSSFKYRSSIKMARNLYLTFWGATLAYFSWDCMKSHLSGDMSGIPESIAQRLSLSVRAYNGYKRFSKLAAGDTAIVDMPPPEKESQMVLNVNTP